MTANRIKQAALAQFAKYGFEGTSLAQIAEAVGIKKQSIATYFPKKEDLFTAVFDSMVQDYMDFMGKLFQQAHAEPVENRLRQLLYSSYQYKVLNPEYALFYKRTVHFPPAFFEARLQHEIAKLEAQSSELYRKLFEEGIRSSVIKNQEPGDLLAAYYCLIDGIAAQMHFYDPEEFHRRLAGIWSIFWDGIKQHG